MRQYVEGRDSIEVDTTLVSSQRDGQFNLFSQRPISSKAVTFKEVIQVKPEKEDHEEENKLKALNDILKQGNAFQMMRKEDEEEFEMFIGRKMQ